MKVKVLESLASGLPVVTTPSGAEGVTPNDGVAVAVSDEALVDAAVELLVDPGARRQRGAAAIRCFEQHHSPGPATAPLLDVYERLLSRRGRNAARREVRE
jgi:glycosyltransferase involved in cell wall biosynthesis